MIKYGYTFEEGEDTSQVMKDDILELSKDNIKKKKVVKTTLNKEQTKDNDTPTVTSPIR